MRCTTDPESAQRTKTEAIAAGRWIAGIMSGAASAWPDALDVDATLSHAAEHGVAALLFGQLLHADALSRLPARVVDALRSTAAHACALELAGASELRLVCDACATAGLDALLLKGAALAYDVYPDASWRARCDVDLLVQPRDQQRAIDTLIAGGYRITTEPLGTRVSHQIQLERIDAWGFRHVCDLHWKLSNRARFADALSFDELRQASIALPRVSREARGLSHEHALWFACVHRFAHHRNDPRTIWLFDVHLLAQALGEDGIRRFASLAVRTAIGRLAEATLQLSAAAFSTAISADVWRVLDETKEEPSAIYLQPGLTQVAMLRDDLTAIGSWQERWALIVEHLFPAEAYMRRTYRPGSTAPLPWLYGVRIATGIGKWIRVEAPP